ncbi:MAG TPA: thiamine pyrophosphate-dependent enzyme, partial [Pirellulales bacterium]|nr:thiamine pyrophosphate-dependent enzyme [Pirellulales bacterium]
VAATLEDGLPSPSSQRSAGLGSPSSRDADSPIVICSTGDGTTQEGEFLEAVAEAVRSRLPVLFLIEDNHLAISTRTTGKTFWDLPGRADEFFGLPIVRVDGADVPAVNAVFADVVERIRGDRSPAIVVLDVQRLTDHSNADDQEQYRDLNEVAEALVTADPIRRLEEHLIDCGVCPSELRRIRAEIAAEVEAAAERALRLPDPQPCHDAKAPLSADLSTRPEYTGKCGTAAPDCAAVAKGDSDANARASGTLTLRNNERSLTMREALNAVLARRLAEDDRVFLFGQDIEDPKGDVFGVTRGLSRQFPSRVVNAPLSEATIVGTCIGRALAGQRPVAFIQFADFLPLALNQIGSELGSMYWRTNGGWQCPVIVMVTCGGFKPGLGPFHSQTLESIAAHTPGIDVVMPSTAGDAAGLLNAAFESGRPTLFFYPKTCLNLADRATSADVDRQFVPLGRARRVQSRPATPWRDSPSPLGDGLLRHGASELPVSDLPSLTLVTWGNTVEQCRQAAESLAEIGIETDLLDLRSLSPWDESTVIASSERTGRLVVVHEDNHTCGFGAEVAATVAEKAARHVIIRRVTRPDTFVPCHFGNQLEILPSYRRVLETCADLFDVDVQWLVENDDAADIGVIRAVASGPADDRVEIVEVQVTVGDSVSTGQVVAVVEAAKSTVDVLSDFSGRVAEILVAPGDRVRVGQPLIRVQFSLEDGLPSPSRPAQQEAGTHERPGVPMLTRRVGIAHRDSIVAPALRDGKAVAQGDRHLRHGVSDLPSREQNGDGRPALATVYASRPACALGSRVVTTAEIAAKIPGWTAAEAIKRTGVERRHWIAEGETAVSLATKAAAGLLDSLAPAIPKISAVLCSVTSPQEATPSVSCQVLTNLRRRDCFADNCFALDLNAACSGFLYGLRLAFDHLRGDTAGSVLLLTSEIISPGISNYDPTTAFLFGDAASATLVCNNADANCHLEVTRPYLLAAPDPDFVIRSPCHGSGGFLQMNGVAVARTAYKFMADALRRSANDMRISPADLAVVLPHPGSIRILQNVAEFSDVACSKVWHTLAHTGNTSSSSIPIALDRFWQELPRNEHLGMTAFGAGFTAASIIATLRRT